MREFLKKRGLIIGGGAAALIAVVAIILVLFLPKAPANNPDNPDNPGSSTGSQIQIENVLDVCNDAYADYCQTAQGADGLIVYCSGSYFVSINNTLYPVNTFTAEDAQTYGKTADAPKILQYTYEDAGQTVLPQVAEFTGMPYITFTADGAQTAKLCNYYLEVTAGEQTYYINFFLNGDSTAENPEFITLYNKNSVQITQGQVGQIVAGSTQENPVKNVIFMIADGGGYDNFTLADKVKQEMVNRGVNKLAGAKTEITTNLLAELGTQTTNGLYLNQFLVGSANTLLKNPHENDPNNYITDSSAAGTALSSGYKTNYCYAGIDENKNPRASITELARLNGMATGLVTTKSYVDATPLAFFTSHSIHRYEYQDNSLQALLSGIDVVIGEGTEYGDIVQGSTSHPDISATTMGYTVAKHKKAMLGLANDINTKKLWAPILGVDNADKVEKKVEFDLAADHISYDIDAALSDKQPSLLEMTTAALQVLGTNINDPDGFFLMIEGGALDNAAEPGCLRPAIGEYLAFDEAFGYCVNWAAQRGDTIVIAVPDHDSGGFSGIESCEKQLIDGIITGKIGDAEIDNITDFQGIKTALSVIGANTENMKLHGGHTEMAVPISLYAPESVRKALLENMGLPTEAGEIRKGSNAYYVPNASSSPTWYSSSALNNDYTIDNTKIAPALTKVLEMGSLDDATKLLFNKVGSIDASGAFTSAYGGELDFGSKKYKVEYAHYIPCTYRNNELKLVVDRNATTFQLNETRKEIPTIGNMPLKSIFVLNERLKPNIGTFYVPQPILTDAKLYWSVTISGSDYGFGKILTAKGTDSIVLPAAEEGKDVIYSDGVNVYHPGDTIAYNEADVSLKAYTKAKAAA